MAQHSDVLVVGGGPVGAMVALLLANRGFSVNIIEKEPHVAESPRALVYAPQNMETLEEAGIIDDVRKAGLTLKDGLAWRSASDHSLLATVDPTALKPEDPTYGPRYAVVLLGQHVLARIIMEKLKATGKVQVYFNHAFEAMRQEGKTVFVTAADSATGEKHEFSASFVLGADGAHSGVRKAIGTSYDGFTHDMHCMSINMRYPQMQATGFGDVQFLVDPVENIEDSRFGIILRTGPDDIWRCFYADGAHYNEEELKSRVAYKLKTILPLNPDPDQYEILLAQPYRIHQRCAGSFVQGRVLLAGDAAHINNPAGGLGLNTGLLDARVAAETLTKALKLSDEGQVAQALQEYNDARRAGFLEYTNPMSIDNLRRLWEVSEEAEGKLRNELFENMKNPEFQREMQLEMNGLAKGVPGW